MKLNNFIYNALLSANILLLFSLVFESRLTIPAWLNVIARMHPLVLHFPVVLSVIVALLLIAAPFFTWARRWTYESIEIFLAAAALTAAIASLMGLFLGASGEYEPDSIYLHKWAGVSTAFILFILYAFRYSLLHRKYISLFSGLLTGGVIFAAGHFGSEITHGENFVFAPVATNEDVAPPAFENALVYDHMVLPVLQNKCLSCHNSKKAKGKLMMDTKELLLKGGKSGKAFDTLQQDQGLLMKRITLPANDKKHMPPAGKPQLSDEEILILGSWIKDGFDFDKKVAGLHESDTLFTIAKHLFSNKENENAGLKPVSDQVISGLNSSNRLVSAIAIGSGALRASFFNRTLFKISLLDELQKVSENIVELNLLGMPVSDDDLKKIRPFKNLRKLNLNFTKVTGATFTDLAGLSSLQTLSLAGTAIQMNFLSKLTASPSLKNVYLGNTSISKSDLSALTGNTKIDFHLGYTGDSTILKLNPPAFRNKDVVISSADFPVKLQHFVNGVEIRYTTDGTEPDSVHSKQYIAPFNINTNTLVKARAFKKGWLSSDVSQTYYFKSTYRSDSAVLLSQPKNAYRARGIETLTDNKKSDLNFAGGKWLGFQNNNLDCLLFFNEPVFATNITLSVLVDVQTYIFRPQKVQVWGGDDQDQLKLLTTVNPRRPEKNDIKGIVSVECNFSPVSVKVIKIVAEPLRNVPSWLQDLKEKGHLFVDEIFIN